jgi:mutator protein MutT
MKIPKREYPEQPLVAVSAVIRKNNSLLLVKREYEPAKGRWSIPGGLVDLGEKVRDAIVREVEEETGLNIEVGNLIDVIDNIEYDKRDTLRFHYIIISFLVEPLGGRLRGSKEASEVKWFTFKEVEHLQITNTAKRLFRTLGFLDNI